MRRTRAVVASLSAAVVMLGLAACGSSQEDPGAGSELGLVKSGTLTVATEGTYRPFSFHEAGGELTGYDVEVARAVAGQLGLEVEFKETQWDAIFAGLDAGRFDTIANQVSITDERKAKYVFSQPYTVSHGVVVVSESDTSITAIEDLKGKTTAQSLTSNWYEMAKSAGADVQPVEGWAQAVSLLQDGRVDATINDSLTYLDHINEHGESGLKVAVQTEETSESAFVTTRRRAALATAIDGALAKLAADGTLTELSEKYFGVDVSK